MSHPELYSYTTSLSDAVTGGWLWRQFVTGEFLIQSSRHASYKLASHTTTSYAHAKLTAGYVYLYQILYEKIGC